MTKSNENDQQKLLNQQAINKKLSEAVAQGNLKLVKDLIGQGAELTWILDSPILYALANGHLNVVRYLFQLMPRDPSYPNLLLRIGYATRCSERGKIFLRWLLEEQQEYLQACNITPQHIGALLDPGNKKYTPDMQLRDNTNLTPYQYTLMFNPLSILKEKGLLSKVNLHEKFETGFYQGATFATILAAVSKETFKEVFRLNPNQLFDLNSFCENQINYLYGVSLSTFLIGLQEWNIIEKIHANNPLQLIPLKVEQSIRKVNAGVVDPGLALLGNAKLNLFLDLLVPYKKNKYSFPDYHNPLDLNEFRQDQPKYRLQRKTCAFYIESFKFIMCNKKLFEEKDEVSTCVDENLSVAIIRDKKELPTLKSHELESLKTLLEDLVDADPKLILDLDAGLINCHDLSNKNKLQGVSLAWLIARNKNYRLLEKLLARDKNMIVKFNVAPIYPQYTDTTLSLLGLLLEGSQWGLVLDILQREPKEKIDYSALRALSPSLINLLVKHRQWEILKNLLQRDQKAFIIHLKEYSENDKIKITRRLMQFRQDDSIKTLEENGAGLTELFAKCTNPEEEKRKYLHMAARTGLLDEVKTSIEKENVDPNSRNYVYQRAIDKALAAGQWEVVKYLFQFLNANDLAYPNLLYMICFRVQNITHRKDLLAWLSQQTEYLKACDITLEHIKAILDYSLEDYIPDDTKRDNTGLTALHYAIMFTPLECSQKKELLNRVNLAEKIISGYFNGLTFASILNIYREFKEVFAAMFALNPKQALDFNNSAENIEHPLYGVNFLHLLMGQENWDVIQSIYINNPNYFINLKSKITNITSPKITGSFYGTTVASILLRNDHLVNFLDFLKPYERLNFVSPYQSPLDLMEEGIGHVDVLPSYISIPWLIESKKSHYESMRNKSKEAIDIAKYLDTLLERLVDADQKLFLNFNVGYVERCSSSSSTHALFGATLIWLLARNGNIRLLQKLLARDTQQIVKFNATLINEKTRAASVLGILFAKEEWKIVKDILARDSKQHIDYEGFNGIPIALYLSEHGQYDILLDFLYRGPEKFVAHLKTFNAENYERFFNNIIKHTQWSYLEKIFVYAIALGLNIFHIQLKNPLLLHLAEKKHWDILKTLLMHILKMNTDVFKNYKLEEKNKLARLINIYNPELLTSFDKNGFNLNQLLAASKENTSNNQSLPQETKDEIEIFFQQNTNIDCRLTNDNAMTTVILSCNKGNDIGSILRKYNQSENKAHNKSKKIKKVDLTETKSKDLMIYALKADKKTMNTFFANGKMRGEIKIKAKPSVNIKDKIPTVPVTASPKEEKTTVISINPIPLLELTKDEQLEWFMKLPKAFANSSISISWNADADKCCFTIRLPKENEMWSISKAESKKSDTYLVDNATISNHLVRRLEKHFAKTHEALLKYDEKNREIIITPHSKFILSSFNKLHERAYQAITGKKLENIVNININNHNNNNNNNDSNKAKVNNVIISKTYPEDAKKVKTILQELTQFDNKPLSEFNFLEISHNKNKNKWYLRYKYAGTKQIAQMDSKEFFAALKAAIASDEAMLVEPLKGKLQGYVQITLDFDYLSLSPPKIINDTFCEVYNQHLQVTEKALLTNLANLANVNDPVSEIENKDEIENKENINSPPFTTKPQQETLTGLTVVDITILLKNLEEMEKIPVPTDKESSNEVVYYINYLLLALRIMELLHLRTKDSCFEDCRNIIRHGYDRLSWGEFHSLMSPLFKELHTQIHKAANHRKKTRDYVNFNTEVKINSEIINQIKKVIVPFEPELKQRTLGKKSKEKDLISSYRKTLESVKACDFAENQKKRAILMLVSMIAETQKPHLRALHDTHVYQELGHHGFEETNFQSFIDTLYRQYESYCKESQRNRSHGNQ